MDQLLNILKTNAREPIEDIARMLDRSPDDIRTQIAQLEADGIIRGYQAILKEDETNNNVHAIIEVNITPEREGGFNHLAHRLSKFPEVTSVYLMSGNYDLQLIVHSDNLRNIAAFVSEKLASIPGVTGTTTHFILKTYKSHGLLMEGDDQHERLKISP